MNAVTRKDGTSVHWNVISLGDAVGFAQYLREKARRCGAEKTAAELDSLVAGLTGHTRR